MKNFWYAILAKVRQTFEHRSETGVSPGAGQSSHLAEATDRVHPDSATRAKILQTPGLFDAQWYLEAYSDVAKSELDPLEHFFRTGAFEGRNPSPVFNTKWYAQQAGFSYTQQNALLNFLENSVTNKISPCPLFDSQFYLKNYADVREAGVNPFSHYMTGGAKERRRPNDVFLPLWYFEHNPDTENPLIHHLKTDSVFSPFFNSDWYEKRYDQLLTDSSSSLAHYLTLGRKANFSPNPYFDALWYQEQYRDQIEVNEDPFAHFVRTGDSSGFSPGRNFDSNWYRWRHADIGGSDIPPFRHFMSSGEREGREFLSTGAQRRKVSDIAVPRGCDGQEYFLQRAPEYETCDLNEEFAPTKPTIIAFYHLTATQGECSSRPSLFAGHYQPRKREVPVVADIREKFTADCNLAKKAGIDIFCLELTGGIDVKHVESLIDSGVPELRLCLRFDSIESVRSELLNSKPCLQSVLNNPAYLVIDSKPVVFLRQTIDVCQEQKLDQLQKEVLGQLGCQLFIIASYDSSEQLSNHCDAFLHDPSNANSMRRFDRVNERIGLKSSPFSAVGYTSLLLESLQAIRRRRPVIKTVVSSWDNADVGGFLAIGSKPRRYEFWLNAAISHSRSDTVCGHSLVCLNSWNDWQNGSYLEPDTHFGFAYLNSMHRAIAAHSNVHFDSLADSSQRRKVVLVGKTADSCLETQLLLKLVRLLKRSFGVEPVVLLLNGGPLQSEFESITRTFVIDEASGNIVACAQQLIRDGFTNVISNTLKNGSFVRRLVALGFDVITLVHEIPEEIDASERESGIDSALKFSRLTVFSSERTLNCIQSKTRHSIENYVLCMYAADNEEALRDYAFDLLKLFEPSLVKVSVAVPNYNYSGYLEARLNSIFAQTYPIYELLVLDDGSSDDSLAVLDQLQKRGDRDFQILPNKSNSGSVFKQWHKSASICSGEVIWIAEADDDSSPEFLRALAPRFYANPELNLIFANSRQTDENGDLLSDNYDEYYKSFKGLDFTRNFEINSRTFLAKALSVRTAIANVSSALIRRASLLSVIDEMQDTLDQLKVAGDWKIYIELCKRGGKIGFIREPLNVHRRHSGSVTHSSKSELLIRELKTIHDLVYAEIPDPDLREEQTAYVDVVQRDHAERKQSASGNHK